MPPVSENSILDRWTKLVVDVIDAEADVATLAEWAQRVHMSVGTLREACRAAGIRPKRSLDFARVLRAVVQMRGHPWMPEAVLNCRDPRTLRALLFHTGCRDGRDTLTLDEFLAHQTVVPRFGSHLPALLRATLKSSGRFSGGFCIDIRVPSNETSSNPR